jgi:DNA-binding NtrC family response regulator
MPPLREHRDDIDELIAHCLDQLGASATLPESFAGWAREQPWPGNVRELRSAIEQTLTLARHPEIVARQMAPLPLDVDVSIPFKEAKRKLVDELERKYITELIDAHGGNVSAAARAADLDRMTIYKMLYRAGLRDKPE